MASARRIGGSVPRPGGPLRIVLGARFVPILTLIWLILELLVLIWVGGLIGALETLGIVVLSALLGFVVVAKAGSRAWAALRTDATEGIVPGRDLGNPVILLVAGVFLIIPGLISSALSILAMVLLPATRVIVRFVFRVLFGVRMPPGVVPGQPMPGSAAYRERRRAGKAGTAASEETIEGEIIEGEIIEESPPEPPDPR